jgi:hypothetical protein
MVFQILAFWGCIPEIAKGCIDMTNASSTYLSIALGALLTVMVIAYKHDLSFFLNLA